MQPGQGAARQRSAEPEEPGRLQLEHGEGAVVAARLEPELSVDVVTSQRPREQLGTTHCPHEQHAARGGAPEQRRPVAGADLPAGAFGQTASVRLHGCDARPPVREMAGFRDERPNVFA